MNTTAPRARRTPRFVVYPAADGWRWQLLAGNGRIVADSGEAYVSKRNAEQAARATAAMAGAARIDVVEALRR